MKTLPTRRFVIALAALCWATSSVAEVPDFIYSTDQEVSEPIWVSEDVAVRGGSLQGHLFSEYGLWELNEQLDGARQTRQRNLQAGYNVKPEDCATYETTSGPPPGPLEELAEAHIVFNGTITGIKKGFAGGLPRFLVEVTIDQLFKAPDGTEVPARAYLPYRNVKVTVGEEHACARAANYPLIPAIGKRALIFSYPYPGQELTDPPLLIAPENNWLFEDQDGKVFLPGQDPQAILDPVDWGFVEKLARQLFPQSD